MRPANGVYVDGKSVPAQIVTERVRRWHWIPRWMCVFAWMWREYQVYRLDTAPPKGSSVVIVYETDMGDKHGPTA